MMIIQDKGFTGSLARVALVTALLLSVPFVAMHLTSEVDWGLEDFVVMGGLIFGIGLAYELIKRRVDTKYRLLVAIALVVLFLLIWAELAVGVFGSPFAGS